MIEKYSDVEDPFVANYYIGRETIDRPLKPWSCPASAVGMWPVVEVEPSMTFRDPVDMDMSCPCGSMAFSLACGIMYILLPPIAVAAATAAAEAGIPPSRAWSDLMFICRSAGGSDDNMAGGGVDEIAGTIMGSACICIDIGIGMGIGMPTGRPLLPTAFALAGAATGPVKVDVGTVDD